jgi:serine protease Do
MPVAAVAPTNGFTEVAEQVTPAVVNDELGNKMEELFGTPFGPRGRGPSDPFEHRGQRRGQGSGVIISSERYILTNNHMIAKAREVNVTHPDKREFKGRIIGTDPKTDLAVTSD